MQLRCNVNQAPLEGSGSPEAEAAAEGAGWGSPSLHTCEKSPIPSSPGAQQGGNIISGHPGSRKLLETPARKQACLQRNHYSLRLAAAEGSGSSPGRPSLLFLFTHSLGSSEHSNKSSSANTGCASRSCAPGSPAESGEQAGKRPCSLLPATLCYPIHSKATGCGGGQVL